MNKYSKGKIYMLKPSIKDYNLEEIYIGSTILSLEKRWAVHKSCKRTTAKTLIEKYGIQNLEIVLLENYPCESRAELQKREGQYIRNRKCVNLTIAGRSSKEYYDDNRLECIKRVQLWVKNNKERYNSYMKTYMANYRLKKALETGMEALQPF
jgi:hypothetical protein